MPRFRPRCFRKCALRLYAGGLPAVGLLALLAGCVASPAEDDERDDNASSLNDEAGGGGGRGGEAGSSEAGRSGAGAAGTSQAGTTQGGSAGRNADASGDAGTPPLDVAAEDTKGPQAGCTEAMVPRQGLDLWLAADTDVVVQGDRVASWASRVGSRRAQPSGNAMGPRLANAALAGQPAVRFDGSTALQVSNLPLNGLENLTLVIVSATTRLWLSNPNEWCRRASEAGCSNTYNSPLQWDETGSWGMVFLSPLQTQVVFRFGVGAAGNNGEYKPTHVRPQPLGSGFSTTMAIHEGAINKLFVDGKRIQAALNDGTSFADIPSPAGRTAIANTRDVLTIGSGRFGNGWQGDIVEILVYRRALPEVEREALQSYLQCQHFPSSTP